MMNISSRSSTPPKVRRRVAPFSIDSGANQQQQHHQHQFNISDINQVGIPSSDSNDLEKNQLNRIKEQFYHNKAVDTNTSSSSSANSGITLVAPPSKTREWRLQRFQQQLQQQKALNQEKQLQKLSSDEYPDDEYTANKISSTARSPSDSKTILSSVSEDEKCRNVYTTAIDLDEIDPNVTDTDTDTDNDDVYEQEEEDDVYEQEEEDDDDVNEVACGDDSSSWYSKNTDDALESQSQQDHNEKSSDNDRKPLLETNGSALHVAAAIKSSPHTTTSATRTSPIIKLSPIFKLSPTSKASPTASPLSFRSNPKSDNHVSLNNSDQIDHILLPSLQQEKLVSIQSLIQNTASNNTNNNHKKVSSTCESSTSVITDDEDSSSSFVSNKTTDAIGSYHIRPDIDNYGSQYADKHNDKTNNNIIHANRLGVSLFKTLHDSGPIVVRNEFHPLRDKPLLLLPISSSQQEKSISEVEDDATIKQGNVNPEAPVRRLCITKTTESIINIQKKTSIIVDNIDNHNSHNKKNNNDIEQGSNNNSKDITFDEVATVVKNNVLRCSHVVGKNVKKVAKKVKENYNTFKNSNGPTTYYMTVTSPIGPTSSAPSIPTGGRGLALATTNTTSSNNLLQVAKISCTILATSEKFISNPIFVLIDTLQEQPQALCIPSSYNQQMRKVLKHSKNNNNNNTPTQVHGGSNNNPFCHHIDESLIDSYIIYGRKQFRTSSHSAVTSSNITGPPSMRYRRGPSDSTSNQQQQQQQQQNQHHTYTDQDSYRQQYYQQRTTQSNVGGTIIASSSSSLPEQSHSSPGNRSTSVDIFRSQSYDIDNEMFYYDGYKYYPWIRVVGTGNSNETTPVCNSKIDDTNTNNSNCPTSAFFQLWNGRAFIDIKQTMTISKSINVAGQQQQTELVKPTTPNDIVLFGDTTAPPTIAAAVSYGGKKKKTRSKYSRIKQFVLPSTSSSNKKSTAITTSMPSTTTNITKPMVLSRIELSDQTPVQQLQQQQQLPSTNKNKNTVQANGNYVTKTKNTPVDVDEDDDINETAINTSSTRSLIASKRSSSSNSLSSTNSSGNIVVSNTTTSTTNSNNVTMSLAERYYTKRITTGTTTQVKRINKHSTTIPNDNTTNNNNDNKKVSMCTIRTIQRKVEEDGWNLNIIPDVDPAIMLCVTVILDEMI